MTNQNGSVQMVMTAESFEQEVAAFVAHMKGVVNPSQGTGRAMFPDFEVTQPIRAGLVNSVNILEKGDFAAAFSALRDTKRHFQNQQAAYARRTLLPELRDDFQGMIESVKPGDDDDIVTPVRTACQAYEACVNQEKFDLSEASRLYWAACDALDTAEGAYKSRKAKREEEARERNKLAGKKVSRKLRGLLTEV